VLLWQNVARLPLTSLGASALQAALCVVVLFTAYVLQQRLAPFLSLRAFNNAVKSAAERLKPASSKLDVEGDSVAAKTVRPSPGLSPTPLLGKSRARRTAGRRKSTWFEPDPEDIARLRNANVRERLRLQNAIVFVGVVMQRVMEDYNHLESTYLISGMVVLLAGLVFNGGGFRVGSVPYQMLTVVVAAVVIGATIAFVVLLAVELYKSFRDADLHAALRAEEAASIETSLRTGMRSKQRDGGGHVGGDEPAASSSSAAADAADSAGSGGGHGGGGGAAAGGGGAAGAAGAAADGAEGGAEGASTRAGAAALIGGALLAAAVPAQSRPGSRASIVARLRTGRRRTVQRPVLTSRVDVGGERYTER
jgi:hypothetical protein